VDSPITVRNTIFDRNRANNPYRTRQHTGWELINGGNNIQFPPKLTPDWARDSNATANITLADPLLGPVQYINGHFVMLPLPGSPALRLRSGAGVPVRVALYFLIITEVPQTAATLLQWEILSSRLRIKPRVRCQSRLRIQPRVRCQSRLRIQPRVRANRD
jgi:hypothetical protein